MIANQVVRSCITELKSISKVDFTVFETDGNIFATTLDEADLDAAVVRSFVGSGADSQEIGGRHLFSIKQDGDTAYVVAAQGGGEDIYLMGRIAASEISHLVEAYREKFDKNNFYQNLILDNMLLVDIYNRAKKLHIPAQLERTVFLIEAKGRREDDLVEVINSFFRDSSGDFVTAVDEQTAILIKSLEGEDDLSLAMKSAADMIVDMMNTEAMISVKVSYGNPVSEIRDVSKSYKEARMAMDVGRIFYDEKDVVSYSTLGIGRLIYQLPENLCRLFLHEVFGDNVPDHLDDETQTTINRFFENNLNVSETSRQLFLHRNTLVYRIERLQKSSGLDIRKFDDAMLLKIALMVVSYLKYTDKRNIT